MISFLQMSLCAAVLTAIICFVRAAFGKRLPKPAFRILWTVVILRMLVPLSLPIMKINTGSAVSVTSEAASVRDTAVYAYIDGEFSRLGNDIIASPMTVCEVSETTGKGLPAAEIWLFTAAAVFAAFVSAHIKFRLKSRDSLPAEISLETGIKRHVRVKVSDRIDSPLTYGIFRPVVLLPKSIYKCDEKTVEYILAHEFTHIKRFDALYKLLAVIAVSLHWFNPLAWVMFVLSSRDMELSCDEEVVLGKDGSGRKREEYALTIIEMEEKRSLGALASGFGGSSVKERIKAVMTIKRTSAAGKAAAVLLVAIAFTVFTVYDIDSGAVYSVTVATNGAEAYYDKTSAVEGTYYSDYVIESAFDEPFTMEEIDRALNNACEIVEHAPVGQELVEAAADEEVIEYADTETKITYAITTADGTTVLRDYPESYSLYRYSYADAITGTNKIILLDLNVYSPFDFEKYGLTVSPEKGYYIYGDTPVAGFQFTYKDTNCTLMDDIAEEDGGDYFIYEIDDTGETIAQVGKEKFLEITE